MTGATSETRARNSPESDARPLSVCHRRIDRRPPPPPSARPDSVFAAAFARSRGGRAGDSANEQPAKAKNLRDVSARHTTRRRMFRSGAESVAALNESAQINFFKCLPTFSLASAI